LPPSSGRKIRERGTSVSRWLQLGVFDWWLSLQPPAHAGSSLEDFSTLKMEAIRSSEMSVHTISTRLHIPENGILHTHRRENLKSYLKINVKQGFWIVILFNCKYLEKITNNETQN
jgi:hypothetical protein